MYPASFFGLFPPFPRDDRVFLAMSFDSRFDRRWNEVIAPAVVFTNTYAMTQPEVLVARAHEKFDQAGALIDQATRGFLARFLEGFSEWIAHFAIR